MRKQILLISVTLSFCTIYAQKNNQTPVQPNRKLTHNTPAAERQTSDTIPVVKANTTINANTTLREPSVISIPAEAFRPSNEIGNNGYYKIRRDGLGTLAGSSEIIRNTLVAPLVLPDGAVITKIEFNVLSLYPHGYRPHLRLVQRGVVNDTRQKGGYMGVTRVNKYSASSQGMTGETGLANIQTLRSENMSYKIDNKTSSYFFEVLANRADHPPIDARDSEWPNDNYLFIWSVEVYYSLN